MKAWLSGRISTAKTGWLIVVLMLGWVAFLVVPFPREKRVPSPSQHHVSAQTRLEATGLSNNPDWQGLQDYFAVWADTIEWTEKRTYFAYWHPGSSSYSYFFEAIRETEGIRFRVVSAQVAGIGSTPQDGGLTFDENELAVYAENREANSPTHPFVFSKKFRSPRASILVSAPHPTIPAVAPAGKVEVNAASQPISVPVVISPGQPNVAPKK